VRLATHLKKLVRYIINLEYSDLMHQLLQHMQQQHIIDIIAFDKFRSDMYFEEFKNLFH